jgi:hypothetical protein
MKMIFATQKKRDSIKKGILRQRGTGTFPIIPSPYEIGLRGRRTKWIGYQFGLVHRLRLRMRWYVKPHIADELKAGVVSPFLARHRVDMFMLKNAPITVRVPSQFDSSTIKFPIVLNATDEQMSGAAERVLFVRTEHGVRIFFDLFGPALLVSPLRNHLIKSVILFPIVRGEMIDDGRRILFLFVHMTETCKERE